MKCQVSPPSTPARRITDPTRPFFPMSVLYPRGDGGTSTFQTHRPSATGWQAQRPEADHDFHWHEQDKGKWPIHKAGNGTTATKKIRDQQPDHWHRQTAKAMPEPG